MDFRRRTLSIDFSGIDADDVSSDSPCLGQADPFSAVTWTQQETKNVVCVAVHRDSPYGIAFDDPRDTKWLTPCLVTP